ncbi:hypothetical protein [Actinokineospora pegani]|uniref:hypothetical protein n=1 Tax=Actinokineospora pegani TaxID=2654637 RepID=UPI0012EA0160|nr:hypothetical protein [Actinokineospora pegani]
MTYPPQQPGSHGGGPDQTGGWGGWGQDQGQQRGNPQHGNQPHGGGYPGSGGFPQQGYEGTGQFDGHNQGQPGPGGFPQPPYQGYPAPGFPGGGPPKKNTAMIVSIVAVVVLLLGGGGIGAYFLLRDNDTNANGEQQAPPATSESEDGGDDSPSTTPRSRTGSAAPEPDETGPAAVLRAYMDAYESKSFGEVVNESCAAYKKKYGTDTTSLEDRLRPYSITATDPREPTITGTVASAKFQLELTTADTGKASKYTIEIKVVRESGEWKFCGEKSSQ